AATIAALAATGAPVVAIARAIGIGPDAFRDRLQREAELAAAFDIGREQERRALHGALYKAALAGNITASIFLLKTKHSYDDRGASAIEDQTRVNITVAIPAALSVERYGALIEGEKAR